MSKEVQRTCTRCGNVRYLSLTAAKRVRNQSIRAARISAIGGEMRGSSAAAVRLQTLQQRQNLQSCLVCGSSQHSDKKVKVKR